VVNVTAEPALVRRPDQMAVVATAETAFLLRVDHLAVGIGLGAASRLLRPRSG